MTGGAGFIGSHLVEYLHGQGHEVRVIDNLSSSSREVAGCLHWSGVRVWVADCQNKQLLRETADGCDYIYHCASTVGVQKVLRDPVGCIRNILDSTRAVLDLGVPGMYFSTSEVYGKESLWKGVVQAWQRDSIPRPLSENDECVLSGAPRWSYAAAKLTGEWLALDEGWQVVRLFNVVGPRQNPAYGAVMPRFVQAALEDRVLEVYGDGSQVRTFTAVSDVVRILDCLRESVFDVVNVGGNETVSIRELAILIHTYLASVSDIVNVPYEKAYPQGFEECPSRIPDLTKLHSILGVQQYKSLETIIKEMADKWEGTRVPRRAAKFEKFLSDYVEALDAGLKKG